MALRAAASTLGPRLAAALLAIALAAPSCAGPAAADAISDCNGAARAELQIRACSMVIEDDRTTRANIAIAHMNRANAFGLGRQFEAALKDYDAALAINPEEPLAYYNRANVHFDLGNVDAAIADYTRAIAVQPAFALAYYNRGLARERHKDIAGAVKDFRAVLALDPKSANARAHLRKLGADVVGKKPAR